MKRIATFRLLAGSIVLAAGAAAPNVQAKPGILGREMFVQMDADRDSRVSKREYLEYGTAYLKKKGKCINRNRMEEKFLHFDHDGDGFISGTESVSCSPQKVEPKGHIMAKAEIRKNHDRRVDRQEKIKPVGTLVTITTRRIKEETQSLTISVSNGGPARDTFELCWYFFCRSHDGDKVRVYDEGSKHVTLDPRDCITHDVLAKTVSVVEESVQKENEDTGFCTNPVKSVSGDRAAGYLVLLKHNNVILDKESSSKDLLAEQWLGRL